MSSHSTISEQTSRNNLSLSPSFPSSFPTPLSVPPPYHLSSNYSSQMVSCDVIPPLGNSDHNGIGLLLNWSSKPPSVKAKQRSIWKYDHADIDKANRVISDADWSFVKDQIDVDVAWDLWEQKFLSIMEECIPKGTIPTRQIFPG